MRWLNPNRLRAPRPRGRSPRAQWVLPQPGPFPDSCTVANCVVNRFVAELLETLLIQINPHAPAGEIRSHERISGCFAAKGSRLREQTGSTLMSSSQADQLSSIPSATGALARLACARLREFGKDAGAILAQAGATPEQAYDDSVRLEVSKQIRILDLAAEELGDELLGFHLGRNFDLREIGLVYYVIASSERLADAMRNAERYSGIMNDGVRLHFRQDNRTAAIALDYVNVDRHSDRHQIEFWLVTVMRICRQITDTRLAPLHLKVKHRRDAPPAEFKTFFGTEVEFGAGADEVVFPPPVASLPLVRRDNYLNDLLRRYADEALARRPRQHGRIRSAVEDTVP